MKKITIVFKAKSKEENDDLSVIPEPVEDPDVPDQTDSIQVLRRSNEEGISEPVLLRKRRAPARMEIGSGPLTFSENPEEHYRRIDFKALDLIVNAIDQRFNQPSFTSYEKMESLFIKGLKGEPHTEELKYMKLYNDDLNLETLKTQLQVLRQLLKDKGTMR